MEFCSNLPRLEDNDFIVNLKHQMIRQGDLIKIDSYFDVGLMNVQQNAQ